MASLFRLAPAEPFRVFFPVGLVLGIAAVALWPLYQIHAITVYPAVIHARVMIEGFFAAFIFGFLGTAGPRMLSAPHLTGKEVSVFVVLLVALNASHFMSAHLLGDILFFVLLVLYAAAFAYRFSQRADLPPPHFVLVIFGLVSGMAGTALLISGAPSFYMLGSLLLYQGFVFFPVLGIGTFLFPRFLGLPIPPSFPDSRTPPPGWLPAAGRAALFGAIILATFPMEASGSAGVAIFVRFAAALAFLLPATPLWQALKPSALKRPLRGSILLMFLGLLLMALFTNLRVTMLHVLFIGGFGLIVLLVATRVMFGHSGCGALLQQRAPFIIVLVALTHASLVARVAADFFPQLRMHLVATAGLLWLAGAVVWGIRTVPKVFIPDPD